MEMHEYLSVNKPLSNETVIERIRSYYLTLMEELCDGESLNREFDVKLSVDGKLFSVVNNIAEIQRGGPMSRFSTGPMSRFSTS